MTEQPMTVVVPTTLRGRWYAWRIHRRAIAGTRRQRAATAALAAVSRVPGVERTGWQLAGVCVGLGLVLGLILAVAALGVATGSKTT